MKIKALLPVFLLASSLSQAALQNTITVTTTVDENGTGSACSLREAVQAVISKAAYGGCAAGSRLGDPRQGIKRRRRTIELASAMVGYNHTIDTVRHRFCGVFWVEDALKN